MISCQDASFVRKLSWRSFQIAIGASLLMVLLVPFWFLVSISLQGKEIIYVSSNGYSLFPSKVSIEAYSNFFQNEKNLLSSFLVSTFISAVSAVLAIIASICLYYVLVLSPRSQKSRREIGLFVYSLRLLLVLALVASLLPVLTVLDDPGRVAAYSVILAVPNTTFGLLLLSAAFFGVERWSWESLRLEGYSNAEAYWLAYVSRFKGKIILLTALMFAVCWSEYQLASFIFSDSFVHPFSMKMQAAESQYSTDYPLIAAGGVLALFISIAFLLLIWGAFARTQSSKRKTQPLENENELLD